MRLLSSPPLVSPPSFTSHHVLFISGPFLKDLQRLAGVQHAGCGKHNLRIHHMVKVNEMTLSIYNTCSPVLAMGPGLSA